MLEPSSSEESDTDLTDDGHNAAFAGADVLRGGRPNTASSLLAGRVGFAGSAYGFGYTSTSSNSTINSGLSGSVSAVPSGSTAQSASGFGYSSSTASGFNAMPSNSDLLQHRSHSLTMGIGAAGAATCGSGNTSSLESIGSSSTVVVTSTSIPTSVSACSSTRSNSIRPASPSPSLATSDRSVSGGAGAGQVTDETERSEKEEEDRRRKLQLYVFVMRCVAYPFNAKQPTDMARRQIKVTRSQLTMIRERFQVN
jgi:hypothetical protein